MTIPLINFSPQIPRSKQFVEMSSSWTQECLFLMRSWWYFVIIIKITAVTTTCMRLHVDSQATCLLPHVVYVQHLF